MAQRQVKVVGPPPSVTQPEIPFRLPIAQLIKNKCQWSLYILALDEMQKKVDWNAASQVSYWQLSSLHGLPYRDQNGQPYVWDTVQKDGNWCAHGIPTFPTWHRPYVSLFEQVLVLKAQDIVRRNPNRVNPSDWDKAADTLRAPYWDWAIDALPPDEVIANKQLTILGLDGNQQVLDNPLYDFTYPNGSIPIENLPKTTRHPDKAGETNVEELKKALKRTYQPSPMAETMRDRIFKLHRDANTWEVASNDGGTAKQLKFREGLEQPHGAIHVAVGGSANPVTGAQRGTMAWVPTAGFDPTFMLHHAQVDRQLALWQTYHYDQWIPKEPGLIPLTPFWDGKQEFNSSGIKEFKIFQYQYPEFEGIPKDDPVAASKFIWKKIEGLYGPPQAASEPSTTAASTLDWFAHLRTPVKSIKDSFTVFCFLGSVPENPQNWPEANNLAGTYIKFAGTDPAECANCRQQISEGIEAHGVVALTPALKHCHKYNEPERDVEKYLRDNLEWRILQADGAAVDPRELEGFRLTVWSQKLTRPRGGGGHFPAFPDPEEGPVFHDVTEGKPGGGPDPTS